MIPYTGLNRVIITNIYPQIDCGRFPIKRILGDKITIEVDIFADGHDEITAFMFYKHIRDYKFTKIPIYYLDNDRWRVEFIAKKLGIYQYYIHAYIDNFKTLRKKIIDKKSFQQDISLEIKEAQRLIESALDYYFKIQSKNEYHYLSTIKDKSISEWIADSQLIQVMSQCVDERLISECVMQKIIVERPLANFSAWYELFPRSLGKDKETHGTFNDVINHLPYIKNMGFDIIYLPPIHPIGKKNRKGKNNAITALADEPGSPWAIGNEQGGHFVIHPQLGTLQDFKTLIQTAKQNGMEIALDFALQCSADHPYLKTHPEWFKIREDGSLQYAENPPKKYQDIYPFNFNSEDWVNLWYEIQSILEYWIQIGVTIFRVDNPHTKPFNLWRWLILELKKEYPETIFLSEAFTRPNVKYYLAKCGFSQSYTYFTWRNSKQELMDYFNELNNEPLRQYFRPNLWTNTPDILHVYLQQGGKAAFKIRLTLAATLGSNYGIYGPAFEYCINTPVKEGSEEYLDSEKYEIRHWPIADKNQSGIQSYISLINTIRKQHQALQNFNSLKFQTINNDNIIAYSKHDLAHHDILFIIINLDYDNSQSGDLSIDLSHIGINSEVESFKLTDLLSGKIFTPQKNQCLLKFEPDSCVAYLLHCEILRKDSIGEVKI